MTPVDRRQPPPPGPVHPRPFPPFSRHALPGGLSLLAARLPRLPLVSLELYLPAAGAERDGDAPGIAALHAGLLDEGTARRSSLEIAGVVERLGGSLGSGADWDGAGIQVETLAAHLGPALELLAEVAREASFPDEEVARVKRSRLAELLRRRDQPAALAEDAFARAVYAGTPYGRPLLGDAEVVSGLDRDALVAFHAEQVGPAGATLIAVGDLEPEALARAAEAAFSGWEARALAPRPALEPRPLAAPEVHLVDRPGSAQTQLLLGHRGVPRSAPGYPERVVLNAILGGKFTSRINLNLRERHGYTYGASSAFSRRRGPGPFTIRTAVATEVAGAAAREVIGELARIRAEPPTAEELDETRRYLVGVFPYTLQTVADLAKRLEDLAVHELPDDYYEDYPAVLARVGAADVLAAARRFLRPEELVVVAVGPEAELRPQLDGLGELHLHAA